MEKRPLMGSGQGEAATIRGLAGIPFFSSMSLEPTMLPGPVFFHELRFVARQRRAYALRTILGLFLLYLVIQSTNHFPAYAYQANRQQDFTAAELARIGMSLWAAVIWLQAIVILLLTPAFVAGTIAEERQRKVLGYLLASPLSGAEIVLGKLAARLLNLVVLVAVGLPVVSLALFLGGIDPDTVWLCYGTSFSTLYLVASLSILVSTFSQRPRDAILRAYLIELAWLMLPLMEKLCEQAGGEVARLAEAALPITQWTIGSSPAILIFQDTRLTRGGGDVAIVYWLIGLQVVLGTLLLAWCTLRLRPMEKGSRLWASRWLSKSRAPKSYRLFARRPCGDAPMIWKECSGTLSGPGVFRAICLIGLVIAGVGGLGYAVYRLGLPAFQEVLDYGYGSGGSQSARNALSMAVRVLTVCLYLLTATLLGAGAATGITMERERDAWTSLTVTALEGHEIVTGKILGAFWRVRGLLIALPFAWLIGMICGAVHPLGFLLAIVTSSINLAFIAVLGTYISLCSRSSARAIAASIAILVFVNGGYLFCCMPALNGPETIITAGASPWLVTAAPFSWSDLELHPYPRYGSSLATLAVTFVINIGFYSALTFALFHTCLARFEIEVDRPRLRDPYDDSKILDREGIVFQEQANNDTEQDGIVFVEPTEQEKSQRQGSQGEVDPGSHADSAS